MKEKVEKRVVGFASQTMEYTLTRKKVKNINLRVKPDGSINVSASTRVSAKYIDDFVISRQTFIIKALEQIRKREEKEQKPLKYENGEIVKILGKEYTLEIMEKTEKTIKESVIPKENKIHIIVKDVQDRKRCENLYKKWIGKYEKQLFIDLCEWGYGLMKNYGVPYPVLKIRSMKSRWGSCQPYKGIITLNSHLIEKPVECIKYVVIHEFAHFIHPDHSKKFYDFVSIFMPDWKERRKELNEN